MYSVIIKNGQEQEQLIHSPYVDNLKIEDAKIVKSVDDIDSFSFLIYPNNQGYNNLKYLTTQVEVINERTGITLFRGRILEPQDTMNDSGLIVREVVCASELSYLQDSVQKWGKWQNLTPKQFFTALINEHNSQVEAHKRFTVGNVDVTNSTDNVYRYTSDETNTYDTIKDKLLDRLGGELQIRYQNGVRYLDYLQKIGQKGSQKIELSNNLKSISRSIDPSEIITVLKPLGNQLEQPDDDSSASDPRLTIESVNGGSSYLRDEAKIQQFGIRVGAIVWDDVTLASNLLSKGRQFLVEQKTALIKYQIEAIDLAPIGLAIDSFECGWRYDVYNPLMGIDEELRVIGQTIDINDPTGSVLSIGDKILTQEQYNQMLRKQIKSTDDLRTQLANQSRSFVVLQNELKETERQLTVLREQVESGSGEVEGQITALIEEVQDLVTEIGTLAESIPSDETMANIATRLSELELFKTNQTLLNEQQAIINSVQETINEQQTIINENQETINGQQELLNLDFEARISALETPQE